jgi:hypothetical protein
MTLDIFKFLDEKAQAGTVLEEGVHLDTRYIIFHTVALYQIEGFYVEIFYNKIENQIGKIKSYTKPLEPYINKIDLTAIL